MSAGRVRRTGTRQTALGKAWGWACDACGHYGICWSAADRERVVRYHPVECKETVT